MDDFLKTAEESSMMSQSISLPAINYSQTLTDKKTDRSQIIKSIIHQCQDMSKDMSK